MEKLCCRNFVYEVMTKYLHSGQRITFDTNMDDQYGKDCEFIHSNNPCHNKAVYVVTLTAKYEVPPFPHSLKRLTKTADDFKAEFLK